MTKRFLAGLHPLLGTMGIWMTNAGIDVETNTDSQNFALSPNAKMEQIWFSGVVSLNNGDSVTINFPAALAKRPYIFFVNTPSGSSIEYPYPLSQSVASINTAYAVGIRVYVDRIEITNSSGLPVNYHYMVFRRTIGS